MYTICNNTDNMIEQLQMKPRVEQFTFLLRTPELGY